MVVLSVRVSEQQKAEIEQAALAARLSVPDYMRRSLATNHNEILKSQICVLKEEAADVASEVQKLRAEIITLAEQAGKTAAELTENVQSAQVASKRIKGNLDKDRLVTLGVAAAIGWLLALSAALAGVYLMR